MKFEDLLRILPGDVLGLNSDLFNKPYQVRVRKVGTWGQIPHRGSVLQIKVDLWRTSEDEPWRRIGRDNILTLDEVKPIDNLTGLYWRLQQERAGLPQAVG